MAVSSATLADLTKEGRADLERRLFDQQSGRCFICDDVIDLKLHQGQLDVDHIDPLAGQGADDENNFALTHAACNRSKGASDLRVARRMAEFERLQEAARQQGERGAHLGHLLSRYGGAKVPLRLRRSSGWVEFSLDESGRSIVHRVPVLRDQLSGMDYCFAMLPLTHLHHDDRINPRSIGSNLRGLIEEFMKKRPQLHVALAWWSAETAGEGRVRVFDGQHKAAAQILLGVRDLPVRIFLEPDLNILLQTNTNAGDKLRQVAFDAAVMRHLGSTLYAERVHQFQELKGLSQNDYEFSERDLVAFFRGEHRELLRYIIDSVRDSVTHNQDNRLMEFVEWSGKGSERPLAYSSIERTFFSEFLYKGALETPIDQGMEQGENPRQIERVQLVRLMSLFADILFVGHWDPEFGGSKLEYRLQKGDQIPEAHLRAWRMARAEILGVVLEYVRLVIENHFVYAGQHVEKDRLMQRSFPESLWQRMENFLSRMAGLPCWIDKNLSLTVFGAKQNEDFWRHVFKTGKTPTGVQVLAKPLDVLQMIQNTDPKKVGAA